jgi:alkaline phosphatase
MKIMIATLSLWLLCCFPNASGQELAQRLHAHNDYDRERPFWTAWEAGCGSVEADLYWYENDVYVAHGPSDLPERRQLSELYLDPLREAVQQNDGQVYSEDSAELILLIDIKNKPEAVLSWLLRQLEAYPDLFEADTGLRVALSGKRPAPGSWEQLPGYVQIDGRPGDQLTEAQWDKVAMISVSFREVGRWNGKAPLSKKERERFQAFLRLADSTGKPMRFWATPDKPTAWRFLLEQGAGFVNTDSVRAAADFYRSYLEE